MTDVGISDEQWWDTVKIICEGPKRDPRKQHTRSECYVIERDRETGDLSIVGPGQKGGGSVVRRTGVEDAMQRDTTGRTGRYKLVCRRCGMDVTVRRENLADRVAGLVAAGITQVTLAGLSANL